MDISTLIISLAILVIFVGGFMFMLTRFFQSERERRNFELRLKYSENILPNKLQAYERMTLFLERIKPASLIRRVAPTEDGKSYEYNLIETIQTEFEHNLAQQVYINPNTWKIILSAKNATQLLIKNTIQSMEESSVKEIQEEIIKQSMEDSSPSSTAILYLQKDIQDGI
ncbi:hypothetical protein [uncultured Apibacter sp.]|uniref:DUF7935 family protein n=1 Tax=uncultured Apibacter sp. TaxID=1778616 RepID=UPI0025FC3253|nr:hypothetical protein [uncultured Apibacter sp.]